MNKNQKLKIEQVDISLLKSLEYNPRYWSDKQTKDLTASIKRYGLVDPLLVNGAPGRENVVLGGNFRLEIAKGLGYKTVPVIYLHIADLKKEQELSLRLNKNQGEFDLELLKDFDLDMLMDVGFEDADLSAMWDEQTSVDDDHFDVDKELAEIKVPKTKVGDLYQLGKHKLLCGDATDPAVIKKLIGDKKVDLYNLDPIYNIGLNYDKGIGGKANYGGKVDDSKSPEEYHRFLTTIFSNCLKHRADNCHVFCWNDERHIGVVQQLFAELGVANKRVCLWIKNGGNPTPQVAFNKAFEPCIYGTVGSPYLNPSFPKFTELLNQEIENGNRSIDDIMDIFNIWLCKRIDGTDYEHATQKPITLYEKALKRCSKPGDIVMEAFGGSGSLMMACEQLGRHCYMTEIEPLFCDLIIRRWEQMTGLEATKIEKVEVKNAN
ncbi:MAG: ParB N-terminal domain-containing protein [Pseudomonadales bacterium]|nr:ParB N-terminal domain-containing protein [Pseudomonadales bacterium]